MRKSGAPADRLVCTCDASEIALSVKSPDVAKADESVASMGVVVRGAVAWAGEGTKGESWGTTIMLECIGGAAGRLSPLADTNELDESVGMGNPTEARRTRPGALPTARRTSDANDDTEEIDVVLGLGANGDGTVLTALDGLVTGRAPELGVTGDRLELLTPVLAGPTDFLGSGDCSCAAIMAANGLAAFTVEPGRAGAAAAADGRILAATVLPPVGLEAEAATGTGVAALPCLTRGG
jgi:hypothetical protein